MAVTNQYVGDFLRQMAQSQLQEYARQQMALGPLGSMGLGGVTGQGYPISSGAYPTTGATFSYATSVSSTDGHPRQEPTKVEYPERGVHDHLQRRVNKWLKGIELPLH